MDEGPSRPVARHFGAVAGTPSRTIIDGRTAVIRAGRASEGV
jgi:hypothetical protein